VFFSEHLVVVTAASVLGPPVLYTHTHTHTIHTYREREREREREKREERKRERERYLHTPQGHKAVALLNVEC
jgi:hypothetical protein